MMLEAKKQTEPTTRGHRIALYPGAFRPPHAAHLMAVLHLATQSDIDEVIVIISNRCRIIPGTTKALDADIARRIWSIYLKGLAKVRIEIAAHTAVRHALDYFNRLSTGDTLLFCIGESDLHQGDDRFTKLSDLARRKGVSAKLIAAPTAAMTVRSTALRAMLASGASGRIPFMAALPTPLNKQQRTKVWSICSEGMKEISELVQGKVRAIIEKSELGDIRELRPVQKGKIDPVFRVLFKDGRRHFIKYAGDTVEPGCFGEKFKVKPRRRLSTERRALKRLRDHKLDMSVDLPEVVLFDKKTLTLVLTEVCAGSQSLLDNFKGGRFDPSASDAASSFLAECHSLSSAINPVWGDHETDLAHWEKMLDLKTTEIKSEIFPGPVRQNLEALKCLSNQASQKRLSPQLLILDYRPKNIFLGQDKIGIIGFECCSSIGDPAYDFGLFLGHTLFQGLLSTSESACRSAIETSIKVYRERLGNEWLHLRARVAAFSGAAILGHIAEEGNRLTQEIKRSLLPTAEALLSWGLCRDEEIDEIMGRAASGQFAIGSKPR